jgi:hypothetical protein
MGVNAQKGVGQIAAVLNKLEKTANSDMASDCLNHVAAFTRLQLRQHMKDVFDKPISRTLNSIFIKFATPNMPESKIYVDDRENKGASPAKYLRAQEAGRHRNDKRVENALNAAGILPEGMQIVGKQVDAYGNMKGSLLTQMLSALQANPDGFQDSKDPAKRGAWAVARRKSDGQPFGIFRMQGVHKKLFMIFSKKQTYGQKFKFFEVVQDSWNKKIKDAWAKSWARHVSKVIPMYSKGG